jgi:hypothetical protein
LCWVCASFTQVQWVTGGSFQHASGTAATTGSLAHILATAINGRVPIRVPIRQMGLRRGVSQRNDVNYILLFVTPKFAQSLIRLMELL